MRSILRRPPTRCRRRSVPRAAVLVATALLVSGIASVGTVRAVQPRPQPTIDAADLARRIHGHVNEERVRHRLPALAWDAKLARIAGRHSRDMARRNYLGHDGPEGQGFADRYAQAGYSCAIRAGAVVHAGAENIALGRRYNSMRVTGGVAVYEWNSVQQIARQVVDGWMDSRGHRENILTPHWRREGIGVEVHPDNKVYITQNFC